MENTRATSQKTYQLKSKIQILTKKPPSSPSKSLLSEMPCSLSQTPDPSLTVKLKMIHKRPRISQSPDVYNQQTKEALSFFIKNNAITLISPNDFINQIYTESLTKPSGKCPKDPASTSVQKIKKHSENEISRPETINSHRVYTSSSGYRGELSKKIEITGCQIPKLIRKKYAKRHESANAKSQELGWLKLLNTRKTYKPVVIYNKQHNYFRPKQNDGIMRTTIGSYYYSLS